MPHDILTLKCQILTQRSFKSRLEYTLLDMMSGEGERGVITVSILFDPYVSNVDLNSTMLSAVPGSMSSSNKLVFYSAFCLLPLSFCYLTTDF